MAKHTIPAPPDWLVTLVLLTVLPVAVMCGIISVLAAGHGEYLTALRFLATAGSCAGGWMYALKMRRARRLR